MTLQTITKAQTADSETKVSPEFSLDLKEYHVFNNVILKTDSGWARVDHIVVSKYGLFMVETKNNEGRISGNRSGAQWIEVLYNNKLRFQNPVRQTYMNTKSLADFLDIDHNLVHTVVVFGGKGRFKTLMPENILSNIYAQYTRSKTHLLLNDREVERTCRELNQLKANISLIEAWRHIRALKSRYQNTGASNKSRRVLS